MVSSLLWTTAAADEDDVKICSYAFKVGVLVADGLDTAAVALARLLKLDAGGELNAVAVDVGGVLVTEATGFWS